MRVLAVLLAGLWGGLILCRAQDASTTSTPPAAPLSPTPSPDGSAQFFEGKDSQTTTAFTMADRWEVRWRGPRKLNISVLAPDGSVAAGAAGVSGAFYIPKGGSYRLQIECAPAPAPLPESTAPATPAPTPIQNTINGTGGAQPNNQSPNNADPDANVPPGLNPALRAGYLAFLSRPWHVEILALGQAPVSGQVDYTLPTGAPTVAGAPTPAAPSSAAPPTPASVATSGKLSDAQARAVVLIKGDNAEGTGFLVKTADGPCVITNIHVISNNPNLKITTSTGAEIKTLSLKGAVDRDLAMFTIQDFGYSFLDLAADVTNTAQTGDEVITPGNSQGGEVMLNTSGTVLGIGPQRVEFNNPIYHGNSGGPVFHTKSGKVLAVVTEAVKVDVSNDLDKTSFASRNSAITGSMRYFGFRVDNVPQWEPYDWRRFQNETAFLDQFEERNRRLDCYLNAPNDNKPDDTIWQQDDKIMKANNNFLDQANGGADSSQRMDAIRILDSEIADVVNLDMDAIQNPANFYSFDQQRARDALAYRKALKAELENISNNDSRLGGMARKND